MKPNLSLLLLAIFWGCTPATRSLVAPEPVHAHDTLPTQNEREIPVRTVAADASGRSGSGAAHEDPLLPEDLRPLVRTAIWKVDGDARKIQGLMIADRKILDADLAVLKKYPSLRGLDLQLLPITGKGLAHIAELADLERLEVYKCFELKSADFAQLAKLKKLRSLSLSATELGDEGLKEICTLPDLEYLNIGDTRVTDAGLAQIKQLKKLKVLVSWSPHVSAERQSDLRSALSALKIGDVAEMPDPIFRR